jgi:hypothetical protein
MSKNRRSNKESKKTPAMTLKEKRAAKKVSSDPLGIEDALHRTSPASGSRHP